MARTRENGVDVLSAADAQSPGLAAYMGLPTDADGGYAGGDSTADAINNVKGTAESAYQTIDNLEATAHALPAGVDPTVTVTGDMGSKVINVGIPESVTPPEPASFRALAPVRVALAGDDVRVVAIGDSNTEGAGVSSRSDRWFEQVVASLRQRALSGGDTGIGWVPAVSLGGPSGFSWTGGEETSDHVGGKGRVLSGGAVGTFTAAGDVTVMWKGGSGGSFTVKIGSGSAQTINATGNGTQQQTFTATGTNKVTVTGTSGSPVFYGAHFQTGADGVHGWNLGQSGSRVDTWAYGDPQWGAPDSEVPAMQALGLIKPHLVVIALGANGLGGIFGEDYPPSQYATDMAALVTNIRARVIPSGSVPGFLLITPSQLVDNIGTAREHYWLGFERELRRQFQDDALVSILHESDVWQPVSKTSPDPAGYLADTIHWSAAGMSAVGDYIKTWLQRGFSDAPEAVQAVATAQQAATASQTSADAAAQSAQDAQTAMQAQFLTQDEGVADLITTAAGPLTRAALDSTYIPHPDTISSLRFPAFLAHRNARLRFPENSLEGQLEMVRLGFIPESDVQPLADGTLVACHDDTVDRTMSGIGTGTVGSKTTKEWEEATVAPVVKGGLAGTPVFYSELLDRVRGTGPIIIDVKPQMYNNMAPLVDMITARGMQRSVIVESFAYYSAVKHAADAGIASVLLSNDATTSPSPSTLAADGMWGVNLPANVVDSTVVDTYHAVGLKVIVRGALPSGYDNLLDFLAATGADLASSDDPQWATGRFRRVTGDSFATGSPSPGMAWGFANTLGVAPGELRFSGRALSLPADPSVASGYIPWVTIPELDPTGTNWRFSVDVEIDAGITGVSQTDTFGFFLYKNTIDPTKAWGTGTTAGQEGINVYARRNGEFTVTKYGSPNVQLGRSPAQTGDGQFAQAGSVGKVTLVMSCIDGDVSAFAPEKGLIITAPGGLSPTPEGLRFGLRSQASHGVRFSNICVENL